MIKRILNIVFLILEVYSCETTDTKNTFSRKNSLNPNKIPVLNVGTFHLAYTSDAHSVDFNANNEKNLKDLKDIARNLAKFKPTIVIIETLPEMNEFIQSEYIFYIKNPKIKFKTPSEIELLAYEVGRLSNAKRIYGIDHQLEYNYSINSEIKNSVDTLWFNQFYRNPQQFYSVKLENNRKSSVLELLIKHNNPNFLDFLILSNAEMLAHVGTENGYEGADEATKFYQRNIRMYTNLNRINITKNDRVFILLGASHTAYLKDFMSKSPKFQMVNTFEYLK
jgi:hypothetical protein